MNACQQREAEQAKAYRAQALDIAAELGFLWKGGGTNPRIQQIEDENGRTIDLAFDHYADGPNRITIWGKYPLSLSGYRHSSHTAPRITVSKKRTAAAIARDIMNRFYPDFCEQLATVEKLNAKEAAQIEKVEADVEKLRRPLRLTVNEHQARSTHPETYSSHSTLGKIRFCSDGGIHINRVTLTIDQALQFAEILSGEREGGGC